jgi:hypothetical protein
MPASTLLECSTAVAAPQFQPSWQSGVTPAGSPTVANWQVLPRCTVEFERSKDGFKIHCRCDDEVACGALQNLCRMLSEGLCSVCCSRNGVCVCQCNFTCGRCRCEMTKDGCCITCTSGDKECCEILQACCDSLAKCCKNGCCCYVCFNNTPVCCGTC